MFYSGGRLATVTTRLKGVPSRRMHQDPLTDLPHAAGPFDALGQSAWKLEQVMTYSCWCQRLACRCRGWVELGDI